MGAIPTKGTLSDDRKEEGLMLPHRMVTSTVHSGETVLEAESVKAIEGDPAKLFGRGKL